MNMSIEMMEINDGLPPLDEPLAKWKVFAMETAFCDQYSHDKWLQLYSELMAREHEELDGFFEEEDLIVWEPFESWPREEIRAFVHDHALSAQKAEKGKSESESESECLDEGCDAYALASAGFGTDEDYACGEYL